MKKFCFSVIAILWCAYQSEAFVVKTVLFQPADAPGMTDMRITWLIRGAQELYADEMDINGFGRKTFKLEETDGELKIHRIRGMHPPSYYQNDTWHRVKAELPGAFNPDTDPSDKQDDILLIIVAGVTFLQNESAGFGNYRHSNRYGGFAVIAGGSGKLTINFIAHLLENCFGLYNNSENPETAPYSLEHYEARWLDKHYHFNSRINGFEFPRTVGLPTFQNLKQIDRVRMSLEVTSDIGLHQAVAVRLSGILVIGWEYLTGEKSATINIEAARSKWGDDVLILLMDTQGNYHIKSFAVTLP